MKNHVLAYVHDENHAKKKNGRNPDDFGLRSPVFQKIIRRKRATSTVARVENPAMWQESE